MAESAAILPKQVADGLWSVRRAHLLAVLQASVNTLPFFAWYELRYRVLRGSTAREAIDYLTSHHFGTINAYLLAYKNGNSSPLVNQVMRQLGRDESYRMH